MPKVQVNGLTVHYQQVGQGRDLVMIHGLFANLAFWYLSLQPVLTRRFRITMYDLRGHGFTDMPRRGYTSLQMAADLDDLLTHLEIEQAHLVGHSFGGAVGLHYALLHPERVASLTLADARIPGLQPVRLLRRGRRWRGVMQRLQRAGFEVPEELPRMAYSFFEELARLSMPDSQSANAWRAAAFARHWTGKSHVAKRWLQLMQTTSAPAELAEHSGLTHSRIHQMTRPTLAVFGEQSNCLPTLRGLMRSLPGCQQVIIPSVGHFHPVLKPETFTEHLLQFILGQHIHAKGPTDYHGNG